MRTGFVILAHERLDRVAWLVRLLTDAGAAVVVHLDKRVPAKARRGLEAELGDRARVIATQASEWGMFGLVAATLDGLRALLSMRDDLRHVCLLSGSCLPLRPLTDLEDFLDAHPATDFIEIVPVSETDWVQGGLSAERFTLWFPLPWKKRRAAFDFLVDLQRALKVRRKIPKDLTPHLGLQWWCLTTDTVRSILNHARLPEFTRYFRRCWIPDESFFQTLVRALARGEVESRPLTLQRFDPDGRPVVFHDDHRAWLGEADFFFARKADPDADGLYASFPGPARGGAFKGDVEEALFERARSGVPGADRGLIAAFRLPRGTTWRKAETARPYLVLAVQDAALAETLRVDLERHCPDLVLHGPLFNPGEPARFAGGAGLGPGNLWHDPMLRDYRPGQFLTRLIWANRDRPVGLILTPDEEDTIRVQIIGDANARLVHVGAPDQKQAWLDRMCRPAPINRKRRRKPLLPLRLLAWHRGVDAEALGADLSGQGDDKVLAALRTLAGADWTDPQDWNAG